MNTQTILKELKKDKDVQQAKFGCLSKVAKKLNISSKKVSEAYKKLRKEELHNSIRFFKE